MLNECEGCGTRFAHDLTVCPHCGVPWAPPAPTPAKASRGKTAAPVVEDVPEGGE